jgi:hypothetical protein
MFFTLFQRRRPQSGSPGFIKEHYISFEATCRTHAESRASWFGIDLNEAIDPWTLRWEWVQESMGTIDPEVNLVPMEDISLWVVVYLNNSLRSDYVEAPEIFW